MAKLKFKKGYSDVGVFPLLSHVLREGVLIVDDEDFDLNTSTPLTGEEKVKILQNGKAVLTTTQDIANLGEEGTSNAIPLTGTEAGSPVTGDIEIEDAVNLYATTDGGGYTLGKTESDKSYLRITPDVTTGLLPDIAIEVPEPIGTTSKGLIANAYFGANYDDNTYVQKKYVDTVLIPLDYGDIVGVGGVQNVQVYTTGTGTGTASVDLLPTIQIGKDVTVSDLANNAGTHNIQIDAGIGNTILIAGSAPSQDITLSTNGASVTLRKITSTQFMVISKV